jgi:uncharacterized NAD(P)/FAD-binding protein YdhS
LVAALEYACILMSHSSGQPPHILIVGSGFSGTMVAVHVLRLSPGARVTLVERSGRFGPGLAYGTPSALHLLNVPAGNMSAFDDDPSHFLDWVRRRDASLTGGAFVPRGWYGEYLQSVLASERSRPSNAGRLREMPGEAVGFESAGERVVMVVRTPDGVERLEADRLVLAAGNAMPAPPRVLEEPDACGRVLESPAYIHNPWQAGALERVLPDEPMLILGSGLTMMDVVMSLGAREHAGKIVALSRHGLLSRPHRSPAKAPAHRDPPAALRVGGDWDGSVRMLVRVLRETIRSHAGRGTDWRDVITSIRSITPDLWGRLDHVERERFLGRLRTYWDIVRHRAAPETAAAVADLIASRRLSVRAGRLVRLAPSESVPGMVDATFRPRGSELTQTICVARVINCMGPDTDVRRSGDRMLMELLSSGAIRPDALGLGLDTLADGRSVGADGTASAHVLVAGPMRRASAWENTAVPELRKEAVMIARTALADRAEVVVRAAAERSPAGR